MLLFVYISVQVRNKDHIYLVEYLEVVWTSKVFSDQQFS